MLDSSWPEQWAHNVLGEIQGSSSFTLDFVLVDGNACVTPVRAGSRIARLLLALYGIVDKRAFSVTRPALIRARLAGELAGKLHDRSSVAEVDVVFDLRRDGDGEPYVGLARIGVLRVRIESEREGDQSVCTMVRKCSPVVTKIELVSGHGPTDVSRSVGAVHPLSVTRTLNAACWKAALLARRALVSLRDAPPLSGAREPAAEASGRRTSLFTGPSSREAVVFFAYMLAQFVFRLARLIVMRPKWFIAVRMRPRAAGTGRAPLVSGFPEFRRLRMSRAIGAADPWLFRSERQTYLFYEAYDFRKRKGEIRYSPIGADDSKLGEEMALARPYHLAYPCVFSYRDTIYMIPDTSSNRTVELYRARQFPHDWILEAIVLDDVVAVDATFAEYNDHLWLFVGIAGIEGMSRNDELFLFSAVDLTGPWRSHPQNPIVSDVRFARPAGSIFEQDGVLIRPAQDCLRRYGNAVSFRQIEELSPECYREREIDKLTAEALHLRATGVHSYARSETIEAIDARKHRLRPFFSSPRSLRGGSRAGE